MTLITNLKDLIRRITGEVPTSTLVKRGLTVGENFNRQLGCYIDPTHCFLIEIGNNVTFSIRVTLLAHDASTKKITGYTKIGKIKIGNNVFVGANTTILPGVTIGNNVVIGANSVVIKDIPDGMVVAGNPIKLITEVESYKEKHIRRINEQNKVFGIDYRYTKNMSDDKISELKKAVEDGIAYID